MADKIQAMLLMAKDKSGRALEEIIDRVLSQPEIFVFGEFLELPNIQQVSVPSLHLSSINHSNFTCAILSARSRFKALGDAKSVRLQHNCRVQVESRKLPAAQTRIAEETRANHHC